MVFQVSREAVRSFGDFSHEGGARINSTEIIGREPVAEVLGPEAEAISFTIPLMSALGVDPQAEYDRLLQICHDKLAVPLILGGKPFRKSGYRWLIEKVSGEFSSWSGDGTPGKIDAAVTLRKYVRIAA